MKQDSWLYSDSFLKRAFAIWGYHTVANLIIAIPFVVLWIVMATVLISQIPFDEIMKEAQMQQQMQQDQMQQLPE